MNSDRLSILLCSSLRHEIDAISASGLYPDVSFAFFADLCGHPPLSREDVEGLAGECRALCVFGGTCLGKLSSLPPAFSYSSIVRMNQCFSLLLSEYALEAYQRDGAYLVTPGWLGAWRDHVAVWGFDSATAKEFFSESARTILLLDTGVREGVDAELEEFARFVDRPYRVVPVGLDLMRLHIEHRIKDWRFARERNSLNESIGAARKQNADYAMAFDLLTSLAETIDEQEVIGKILRLFSMLFAATDSAFVSFRNGDPATVAGLRPMEADDEMRTLEDALSLDTEYRMLDSGCGFLAKINHNRQTLGVIKVDGIALPQYMEQYLNIGLSTVGVCGLALNNARTFHDVQGITHELQKSEELFRNLATLAPIGIALTDHQGKCGYVNDAWCGVFGQDHSAALNDGWIASLITDDHQSITSQWQAMVDSGGMWAQEFTISDHTGRQIRVLGRAVPLYEDDGTIKAYIAVIVDVTEQRRLEERLRRSREMEAVGQLSAGIAHEFNNILTAIIGYANLLTMKMGQDDSLIQYAERIIERAERAADLTGGLLSFSRQQIVFQEEINLVDGIRRMEQMIIASAGPAIECRMVHEVDTLPVMADEVRLQQVVGNLVCNARDAMPDGGTLTIETSVVDINAEFIRAHGFGRTGAYAVITVADTGKGMSPKTLERIFEPFFTTKVVGQGIGLGLAVAHGIIKQHNGYLAATSEEGKGSIFHMYLPLVASPHHLH